MSFLNVLLLVFIIWQQGTPLQAPSKSRVFQVATTYGADPTGQTDSTDALLKAMSDACQSTKGGGQRMLFEGIANLGGAQINLEAGNDNAVTDVAIFSAQIGVMVSGPANMLSGLAGHTQTRIVNSYLDYTGIVAEDPVQLHISNNLFLGDAFVLLKSVNGTANGVNIVDNMFSGANKDIVQLDQTNGPFKDIQQVVVDRNNVRGTMNIKSTVAKNVQGNLAPDLNKILLFPNMVEQVQYVENI
ncbi:hypothetical protein LIER_02220 [Lithospermum erythrorhizon]|uniref:Pectate lyase superfamily protein domain-containing protein n=1 Tax=Lithospermum erythrorhizon TaxID=34254 RepID=A0AAV3NPD3_LITER